jgi:hypothetical protein
MKGDYKYFKNTFFKINVQNDLIGTYLSCW